MSAIVGWHRLNDRPSSMDETKHMQLAMDYHDWLVHERSAAECVGACVPAAVPSLSIIPAMSLVSTTEAAAVLTHGLYNLFFSHRQPALGAGLWLE